MPIVDLPRLNPAAPLDTPPGLSMTPGALGTAEDDTPQSDFHDVAAAVFEQENNFVSAMAAEAGGTSNHDDGTNAWELIKGTDREQYYERFAGVKNRQRFDAINRDIDREEENRRIIAGAPLWQSLPLTLGAGLLDPTILVPGGAFLRGAKGGFSVARSALAVGGATAGAVAAQEAGLHATQQTRTLEESAINISAAALLGGLLGVGGSALLSRAEWNGLVRGLERELRGPAQPSLPGIDETSPPLMPLGAAAVQQIPLEARQIAGRAAGAAAKATAWLNPNQRMAQIESPVAREHFLNLAENTLYLRGNEDGIATPRAAETLRKQWNAGLMTFAKDIEDGWVAYRKRGGELGKEEFFRAAGMAARRGDEDAIPEVAAAAKSWRKNLAEPLKEAAIAAKLLPEDVSVDTAVSYLSRVYNRRRLIDEEATFKSTVTDWVMRSAPRWAEDFDIEAANKLAAAQDRVANATDAGRDGAERALRDLETELRIEREAKFGEPEALRERARNVANEVFDKLTGRSGDGTRPDFTVATRGPMRGRTFNIPDELIERWLESDLDLIARRYHRIMATDVELAKKYGSPDMRDQIVEIREDYARLREGVTDPARLRQLKKEEDRVIRDVEGVRDFLRGTYERGGWERNFERIANVANAFNYIRLMGQVSLSSVPEAVRTSMVHGLRPFMHGAMGALRQTEGFKLSVREAQLGGNINERVLSNRLATLAEIQDFYTGRTMVEKFMHNMTDIASTWNGIRLMTDATKMIAAVATQNRILDASVNFAKTSAKNRRYLAWGGIDEAMAGRVAKQYEEFGTTRDGVRVANTERWTDEGAREAYFAAMNKDIDTQIVTKSVADIPLFANTPLGRVMFQFNTFNLASHQRVLLHGLQGQQARFVSSVIAMTTLGMLVTYLRHVSANRDMPDFAENPGWWISEGLDNSGIFMVPIQLANAFEKITGTNPIKAPMRAFDASSEQSSKLNNRNLSSMLGPSAGTIEDIFKVSAIPGRLASGQDVTQGQKNAGERLLPFNSYIVMRQMLKYLVNPPE